MSTNRSELLDELRSVAEKLGRAPMPSELEEASKYGITSYRQEFGSWHNSLTVAGLEKPPRRRIPDDELLAELKRLGDEMGKVPSEQDMTEYGGYGKSTYRKRFDSWQAALQKAGLEPKPDRETRSTKELLDELHRLAEELGRPPTSREMDDKGAYSRVTYRNRWGSWNNALEAAGLEPRTKGTEITRDELLSELKDLANRVNGQPSATDMREKGAFSDGVYRLRFGSWDDALKAAGI